MVTFLLNLTAAHNPAHCDTHIRFVSVSEVNGILNQISQNPARRVSRRRGNPMMPQPVGILNNRSGMVDIQYIIPLILPTLQLEKHQQASSGSVHSRDVWSCSFNLKSIQSFRSATITPLNARKFTRHHQLRQGFVRW